MLTNLTLSELAERQRFSDQKLYFYYLSLLSLHLFFHLCNDVFGGQTAAFETHIEKSFTGSSKQLRLYFSLIVSKKLRRKTLHCGHCQYGSCRQKKE